MIRLLKVSNKGKRIFSTKLNPWILGLIERVTGINNLWDIYDQIETRDNAQGFLQELIQLLDIHLHFDPRELENIPETGPVIVVSNYAHGTLDALLLSHLLLKVRKDIRFMANPILGSVEELQELFFSVETQDDAEPISKDISPEQNAVNWLTTGGLLCLFPAGEVSHWSFRQWRTQDYPWSEKVSQIIRKTKAAVVPVHVAGDNGFIFQSLGFIHPALRTLLLPRELANKKRDEVKVRIGQTISYNKISKALSNRDLIDYLQFRSNLLSRVEKDFEAKNVRKLKLFVPHKERISLQESADILTKEVHQLPPEQTLIKSGKNSVYYASAWQMPHLINEIGRLREKTFRRVGVGTGLSRDMDEFDSFYLHLFVWNHEANEIVGAHRIGRTDEIIQKYGIPGLYTHRLFDYGEDFIKTVTPGLEIGRSFIRPKYNKAVTSLFLLWKGVATFISRNPRYRYLFGCANISNDYGIISKNLMIDFIRYKNFEIEISKTLKPRTPFRETSLKNQTGITHIGDFVRGIDEISEIVTELETDFDGVPILLDHYLRLGGKLLGFNVDKHFSNSVEGLIRVDLVEANRRMMRMYMGKSEFESYRKFHTGTSDRDAKLIVA